MQMFSPVMTTTLSWNIMCPPGCFLSHDTQKHDDETTHEAYHREQTTAAAAAVRGTVPRATHVAVMGHVMVHAAHGRSVVHGGRAEAGTSVMSTVSVHSHFLLLSISEMQLSGSPRRLP